MSDVNDNLILYLKLDEIVTEGDNKKVIDASEKSGNSEVKGNPQVVIDETFGSCLSFNGNSDYIYCGCLDFAKQNYTIEAWFKPSLLSTGDIFAATQTLNLHGILVELSSEGRMRYLHRQPAWDKGGINTFSEDTNNYNDNYWHHVAAIKKENEIFLYLDGKQISSQSNVDSFTVPLEVVIGRLCISHSDRYFQGQIAHVRIYNKALSPEEIKRDMDDDLSAITITSFNKTYPLDFNLYEGENKESVIFIDDGTQGQELILEISNNSEQPLTLPALSSNASASNYHFELRFRPETLSPTSLQQLVLKTTAGWSMSSPVTQFDDTVSLYFLASNNQVLGVNNPVSLTLQNINGAAAGGARTTRVELLCPQFTYQGEKVTNYYREKTLSIISHRGKKNIPLHVSFVESNRILNDGKTQNELILRIVNVLKDKFISLIPASKGDEASKFIISFDVQENPKEEGQTQETIPKKDWALGTKSQVEGIEIKGKDFQMTKRHIEEWKIVKDPKGMSPTWTITNQNEENVKLSPEWGLELTISNIISLHPSGQTNLYISYENIPGYWDGTFICTIEKTPILYREHNVGIGTASTTDNRLTVQGNTKLDGQLNVNGAFQLASGSIIRAIIGTETTPNIKGDESIPTVTFVTEFVERIINQRLGGLLILLDRAVTNDPTNPPYGYITGNKVNFGGFLLYESLDPSSDHSYGWGKPLMRLNPPPVKSVSGQIGIAGNPWTKPELSGTLMIDYQINELGELSLSRFVEVYFTGKAQIDMQQFSYQFRENL